MAGLARALGSAASLWMPRRARRGLSIKGDHDRPGHRRQRRQGGPRRGRRGAGVRPPGHLSVATVADLTAGLRLSAGLARPSAIVAVSVVDRWTARLSRPPAIGLPLIVADAGPSPCPPRWRGRPHRAGPSARGLGRGQPARPARDRRGPGTATTVDAVDGDGFFLGGAIVPGLGLARNTPGHGHLRLPRVEIDLPDEAIGTDTAAALQGASSSATWARCASSWRSAASPRSDPWGSPRARPWPSARPAPHPGSWWRVATLLLRGLGGRWCEPAGPTLAVADVLKFLTLVLRGTRPAGRIRPGLRPGAGVLRPTDPSRDASSCSA